MERFGRVQIHNCQFELTIAVTLATIIDGRVSIIILLVCLFMETQSIFLSWIFIIHFREFDSFCG